MKIKNITRKYSDIILILTAATLIRLRFITTDELWFDEAFTGVLIRSGFKGFWETIANDVHPPLFYVIVKVWTQIFGVSDFSLRILPLIFGVLTIWIAYLFTKELFNKETAIIAGILLTVSPFLIGYSIETRMYSLFGLLITLIVYLLHSKKFALSWICMLALIATHYFSSLYLIPIAICYLRLVRKNKLELKKATIALAFVASCALLSLYFATSKVDSLNSDWIRKASFENVQKSLNAYLYGVKTRLPGDGEINEIKFYFSQNDLGTIAGISYFIGFGIILAKNALKNEKTINFLTLASVVFIPQTALIMLGIFTDNNLYVERYLFPSAIFFFITLAYIINEILSFEVAILILAFYVFTLTRIQPPNYYTGHRDLYENYKGFEDEIIFTSPMDYVIGRYYFEKEEPKGNLKLYNPKDPYNTYQHWPHVRKDVRPENPSDAIFISPDENRVDDRFVEIEQHGNFKVYKFVPTVIHN